MKRAYILLETVIAGGIVSIALATSVTMIASSRYETSMAARRAEASSLALGIADELMAGTELASQGLTPVPTHKGFRTAFSVARSASVKAASVPALAADDSVDLIVVTVEYPTSRGAATFRYERLRRKVPVTP